MYATQSLRYSEERKQSTTRIAISITVFFLLLTFNLIRDVHLSRSLIHGLAVILTHTGFSIAWHRFVFARPHAWPPRIYVAMVVDITATTLAFFYAARFGAYFYPVFLWVIVGYGLRYGKRTLFATALLSFVEFGLVLKFNAYWQQNALTGVGLWWGIVILPAFFLTVLNRLGALNAKLQVELVKSKAAEKAKGEFLANMSHEIRTPLNGVLGMAQILADAQIDAEGREHLTILRRSAESLLDIVNDILDFSKITSGKMKIESVPFDLYESLHEVVQLLCPAAMTKGLTLDLDYPLASPRSFCGDPVRIRQIVLNLAGNAVKFTELGGISLTVTIGTAQDGHCRIVLRVTDTGVGIPADRLSAIFDQFEQVDASTSRNAGGTGLGLAISRYLAQKMNGDITVESVVGEGSSFSVELRLPVAAAPPAELAKRSDLPHFTLDVLVAEDNVVNQLVIKKLLKKIGIVPVMAANGKEAIAELERRHYDLVLMDVRMPVMDGLQATRALRARGDSLAGIPIIALTADADSDSSRRCLEAGMDRHLGKPVILSQAVDAIESLQIAAPA